MKRDNVIIELYQKTVKKLKHCPFRFDGPIVHITFDVIDIAKAVGELKTAGFETIEHEPVFLDFWEKGCKYFTIRG